MPAPKDPQKREEWIIKLSESKKGKKLPPFSEEHKRKIGLKHRGKIVSDETRKRISDAHKCPNPKLSETKKRMFKEGKLKIPWKGKHPSEETIQKMRKPKSEEQKRKQSKIMKQLYAQGKIKVWNKDIQTGFNPKLSETRKRLFAEGKIIHPLLGKHQSEESIKKMSESKTGKPNPKCSETRKRLFSEGKIMPPFKGIFGKDHPSYVHGRGYEPYSREFAVIRTKILERDDDTCQMCLTHKDYLDLAGVRLEVHHIDGNKDNNLPQNLISLCQVPCHVLTKKKDQREHWMKYFYSKLEKDYGYKYTEDQKIILDFNEVSQ